MKVVIISGGDLGDVDYIEEHLPEWDLIICADGGARHLEKLNLRPNILVGDFDSISPTLLQKYKEMDITVEPYPREKDWTDTQIAVDLAIDKGADWVYIIGGLGSRWDHSYANIMLLYRLAKKGVRAKILPINNTIEIANDILEIRGQVGQTLSLLPFSQDVIVEFSQGLVYPLDNLTLALDFPLGISNILKKEKV